MTERTASPSSRRSAAPRGRSGVRTRLTAAAGPPPAAARSRRDRAPALPRREWPQARGTPPRGGGSARRPPRAGGLQQADRRHAVSPGAAGVARRSRPAHPPHGATETRAAARPRTTSGRPRPPSGKRPPAAASAVPAGAGEPARPRRVRCAWSRRPRPRRIPRRERHTARARKRGAARWADLILARCAPWQPWSPPPDNLEPRRDRLSRALCAVARDLRTLATAATDGDGAAARAAARRIARDAPAVADAHAALSRAASR
jgi:hypothetical protein